MSGKSEKSIPPSIFYTAYPLEGREGAGTDPSWHWARGGVYPGQVASQSQDWHVCAIFA